MLANEQGAQRKSLLNEPPGALAAKIGAIGQRHPPGEVCDAIVEVCALARLARRRSGASAATAFTLRAHNYLRLLMRDGRLTMTNPNEPSDQQQAYRAEAADQP